MSTCVLLAVAGGFLNVVSVNVLAWPAHRAKERGITYSSTVERVLLSLNILIGLCSVFMFVVATGYGPGLQSLIIM